MHGGKKSQTAPSSGDYVNPVIEIDQLPFNWIKYDLIRMIIKKNKSNKYDVLFNRIDSLQ